MRKKVFKIFLCILFTSGCSQKIATQYRNESNAENITEQDDDTAGSGAWTPDFDDPDSPVSNHS